MKKPLVRVAILSGLIVGLALALWLSRPAPPAPIAVGVDAMMQPRKLFDPTDVNAQDLYLEEHPHSRIRPVQLYYEFNPEPAVAAIQKALQQGVRFFVTTQNSASALATLSLFEDARALVINTTSTSPALTGRDDFFLRIIPDARREQRAIAREVQRLSGSRLLVVQDTGNLPYTDPAFAVFADELRAGGRWRIVHRPLDVAAYKPSELRALMAQDHDVLYILAGSYLPAIGNITQLFHHYHPAAPILLTPWARSPGILEKAGDAVDRIVLPAHFGPRRLIASLDDYYRRFHQRFGFEPLATAIGVRQALELLDQAFAQGHDTPAKVKQYLLGRPIHQTSLGRIAFDPFGDVSGDLYFLRDPRLELP